ncbi:MAG: ROK family protein [Pseudomonadota bacterium]
MKIGVDWGGTKIEVAVLDDYGKIVWRQRQPTPQEDYPGCIETLHSLIAQADSYVGKKTSVGVGIPGTLSPATGLVKNANSTWLNDKPLDKDIALALNRPIRVTNDANCLALSEAVDGAGKDAHCVFAVIVGTGVGGGIAMDKKVHAGRGLIGGEWGHNPLPWPTAEEIPGNLCWCGRHGCIETYVSGTGLSREYKKLTKSTKTGEQIIHAMRAGETQAADAFETLRNRLARGLAAVVNLLDPDMIVLGGGLSNVDEIYHGLSEAISPYAFTDVFDTPIRKARHGDSSGVRGAAWLWNDEF